jgi:two-component system chemotaxis response regulator CheB
MGLNSKIKILIVERSTVERNDLKAVLSESSDLEVLGTAPNGNIGLIKVRDLNPDLVILDAGISDPPPEVFTDECLGRTEPAGIILMTENTPSIAAIEKTIMSLEKGAFDFIQKPGPGEASWVESMQRKLLPKIRGYSIKKYSRMAKQVSGGNASSVPAAGIDRVQTISRKSIASRRFRMVAVGVSTGGPEALGRLLSFFPADFPLPILIVLHMPKNFTVSMARDLDRKSPLSVKEAEDNEIVKGGSVYLARGGSHLLVKCRGDGTAFLKIDDGPPVKGCRPSADLLFSSSAECFGEEVIGVIMTGMGDDGVEGIIDLKGKGALTIAQDEETSLVWGMPGTAVRSGVIDEVVPLDDIARRIIEIVQNGRM